LSPNYATALGLMARWTAATRDGDLTGGDFPGWLADIVGRGRSLGLADRRGECVYSACPHYGKCFIERSVRRARKAEIVVANHALVMVQAALGGVDDTHLPTRYVFDEGHHLFDAADGAFAGHLSGRETAELRRWILGSETGRRQHRSRGLRRRVEGLFGEDGEAAAHMDEADRAARALPGEGWRTRLGVEEAVSAGPRGPTEGFLALVRNQVLARAAGRDGPYSLECETAHPVDGLPEAAGSLDAALERLQKPLVALARLLRRRLADEADTLETNTRTRMEALARALERRGWVEVGGWRAMLEALGKLSPETFVDWFAIEREQGREADVGFYRHWVDPTLPFAAAIAGHAHGMLVTSATLTDGTGDAEADWRAAEVRSGAVHLPQPAIRAGVPSPFDYPTQTRVYVVRDVRKDDLDQVAAAYRELFKAAGGGALGLFTAIGRLRAVHGRIAAAVEAAGLPLYAQHVDGMDVATLVDIFRGEEQACLLGTDAVRDGVDVPGRSLRLIVFDRVPWPRPSILHRARRQAFGGKAYDDTITRLRLKQAYGRLVRRADDTGVFVLLDPMMPTRLCGAFPDGVQVERVGMAEAVEGVRGFLGRSG
jgi:ATP-dependent DNA helicase DinG